MALTRCAGVWAALSVACSSGSLAPPGDELARSRALRNIEQVKRACLMYPSREPIEERARVLAPWFRSEWGTKQGFTTQRRFDAARELASTFADTSPNEAQLILATADRGLELGIALVTRPNPRVRRDARFFRLETFRFDEQGRATSRRLWLDQLTRWHQGGVPGIEGVTESEPALFPSPVEIAAAGDRAEAARVEAVREQLLALDRGDVAAATAGVADGFVDRDVGEARPVRYRNAGDLADAIKRELERYDASKIRILDVWAAGNWVVAHFSRGYRLRRPPPKGSRTLAINYHLWLVEFSGDEMIRRLRFRSRYHELSQLGVYDIFKFFQVRQQVK